MADETNLMWARLRERRWSLRDGPLLKDSSSRRNTLGAAMTQFEEQMTAASVVSSVTRPINLYYALAQAGLAISATHRPGTYTPSSHGLKIVNPGADLPDITVRADTDQLRGSYGIVSSTVGSEAIQSAVSINALWASLPDLTFMPLQDNNNPEVISVVPSMPMEPGPGSVIYYPPGTPPSAAIYIDLRNIPKEATDAWLAEILKPYPGTDNCVLHRTSFSDVIEPGSAKLQVNIAWPYPGQNLTHEETRQFFDGIAPAYRYTSERYLRPSIEGDDKKPPSPLMTWWLLLYTFSMLSRYQPVKWTTILDQDRSPYAAAVLYALQEAISVLPHLVLEALDGSPWLLPKPMLMF